MQLIILTWSTAFIIWVTCISWSTSTNTPVISGLTISIGSTVTRVYTFFISTCQCCWTFRICQTFIWFAFYIWTTLVSRWTLTSGTMTVDSTECFNTTLFIWTWILTFSLNACLCQWTFIITLTTSYYKNNHSNT